MVSLHPGDLKEAWFLHRKVSVDEYGWHEEVDPKYAETLIKQQGQEHARFHRVPGHKQEEKKNCPTSTRATSVKITIRLTRMISPIKLHYHPTRATSVRTSA